MLCQLSSLHSPSQFLLLVSHSGARDNVVRIKMWVRYLNLGISVLQPVLLCGVTGKNVGSLEEILILNVTEL